MHIHIYIWAVTEYDYSNYRTTPFIQANNSPAAQIIKNQYFFSLNIKISLNFYIIIYIYTYVSLPIPLSHKYSYLCYLGLSSVLSTTYFNILYF